jgi:hypothetical protein
VSEFELRRDIAALSTRILNMQREIRRNRSAGANLDTLDADDGRLRHLLDVRGFNEALLSKAIRGRLKTAAGESVAL